MNTLKVFL